MVNITIPVPVPYGQDGVQSVYVRDTDGNEKNITYYHYQHEIVQRLNQLWTFTLDLVGVSDTDKTTWIKENHEILLFWGSQIRMKGRIEKISFDNYEQCHIEGVGMAVKLRDRDINEQYDNTNSDDIVTAVVGSYMTVDTNTNYGLISMSFQSDNRLRSLAGTAQGIDYDWWEDWKSADDYVTNYINVDDFKADPGVTVMTFATSGASANSHMVKEEVDTYETTNFVTCLGMGDGVNQLKAISYHATDNRTTLSKPLDAILDTAINGEIETLVVHDNSGFDVGDTISVDGEAMTISAVDVDGVTLTVAARTGQPSHASGAEVIKTSGKIYVTASTSLLDSGNVWVGQEKISYSAKGSGYLTMTARATTGDDDYFLNGRTLKPYYHSKGVEVVDAQYTEDTAETGSYIDRDGVRSRTFTDVSIIQQDMLDKMAYLIRVDRQDKVNMITLEASDPMEVLATTNLQVGDWVELADTYTGFEAGTRYEVVGMIYGFSIDRGEYCSVEISNYNTALLENTVKETDNLGKYYKGATNVYQVNDSENCDKTHPLEIPFYISPEAAAINKVLASYEVQSYRAYSTTAASVTHSHPAVTSTTNAYLQDSYSAQGNYMDDTTGDIDLPENTYVPVLVFYDRTMTPEEGYTIDSCRVYLTVTSTTLISDLDARLNYWNGDEFIPIPIQGSTTRKHMDLEGAVYASDSGADADMYFWEIYFDPTLTEFNNYFQGKLIGVDLYSDNDSYTNVNLIATATMNIAYTHTHGVSISESGSHSHTVTFAISDNTSEADGINIHVDSTGTGSSYVAAAGNPYNLSKGQDIDITALVGRETGWKKIKFTPTDADGAGKCRILGQTFIQTFIQSKT